MKYGIDIGHNCYPDIGMQGLRLEDELTREVGNYIIEKLKDLGYQVISCLPSGALNIGDSLQLRTCIATENGVDFLISIHFNTGGGRGTEVYALNDESRRMAQKVLNHVCSLGYLNRGVKTESLYVLKNVKAVAILIEGCFIDSMEDMNRYDGEKMAQAIVDGLMEYLATLKTS